MAESKQVTLSPEASAALQEMSQTLNLSFEDALGLAIGTQAAIVKQTNAGNHVTIAPDGKTFKLMKS